MNKLAEIVILEAFNGYQVVISQPTKARFSLHDREEEYVAETKEKLKELLKQFVDNLEEKQK